MARQRKLSPERKEFINNLIDHYHPEDAQDVQDMLKDLLGDTLQRMLEAEMISHMADRILPVAKEWQNRPLEKKYAIVFMDAVHFHVRQDNQAAKKTVYVAIVIRLTSQSYENEDNLSHC